MTAGALSILRIVIALAVVSGFSTGALAQTPRAPARAPVMTDDLMGRLIKYAHDVKETGSLGKHVCKALDLCDGTMDMPLKYAVSDSTDGKHIFGIRPEAGSGDILIVVLRDRDTKLEAYLTDKTARLRAAAISENEIARLITNEKAAAKFQAELALFAKEAAEQLPPTK